MIIVSTAPMRRPAGDQHNSQGNRIPEFVYGPSGMRARTITTEPNQPFVDVLYVDDLFESHTTVVLGVFSGKSIFRVYGENGVVAEIEHPWTSSRANSTRSSLAYPVQ